MEFTFSVPDGARQRRFDVAVRDADLTLTEVRNDGVTGSSLTVSAKKLREILDTAEALREG